jgi:Phage integrase, N-terminal SAM-like domain
MITNTVSPLRKRMIEDMNARKLCAGTQRTHIRSCKRFAAFLKRSPETATFDDIRSFQLHLAETGVSICTRNCIMTGLRFLFRVTLRRLDLAAEIFHLRQPQTIPLLISADEAKRLLAVTDSLKARVLLSLSYGCGLRAGEVVRLKVKHIHRLESLVVFNRNRWSPSLGAGTPCRGVICCIKLPKFRIRVCSRGEKTASANGLPERFRNSSIRLAVVCVADFPAARAISSGSTNFAKSPCFTAVQARGPLRSPGSATRRSRRQLPQREVGSRRSASRTACSQYCRQACRDREASSGLEPHGPPRWTVQGFPRGEAPQAPPADQRPQCPSHASRRAISFCGARFVNSVSDEATGPYRNSIL